MFSPTAFVNGDKNWQVGSNHPSFWARLSKVFGSSVTEVFPRHVTCGISLIFSWKSFCPFLRVFPFESMRWISFQKISTSARQWSYKSERQWLQRKSTANGNNFFFDFTNILVKKVLVPCFQQMLTCKEAKDRVKMERVLKDTRFILSPLHPRQLRFKTTQERSYVGRFLENDCTKRIGSRSIGFVLWVLSKTRALKLTRT